MQAKGDSLNTKAGTDYSVLRLSSEERGTFRDFSISNYLEELRTN